MPNLTDASKIKLFNGYKKEVEALGFTIEVFGDLISVINKDFYMNCKTVEEFVICVKTISSLREEVSDGN